MFWDWNRANVMCWTCLCFCFLPQSHFSTCAFNVIPCPNRCSVKLTRRDLPEHLQHDCPKRKVKCEFCGSEFTGEAFEVHPKNNEQKVIVIALVTLENVQWVALAFSMKTGNLASSSLGPFPQGVFTSTGACLVWANQNCSVLGQFDWFHTPPAFWCSWKT